MSPESIQQRLQEALKLHEAGQLPKAEPIYRAALVEEPGNADALHLLGVLCSDTGRAAEGVSLLTQAASHAPASATIQLNLGVAQRASGDPHAAIEAWERAIQLDPGLVEAHANIASVNRELGNDARAELAWRHVLSLAPQWAEASFRLSELLMKRGANDLAQTLLTRAQQLDPNAPAIATALACMLASQRQFDRALPLFERAAAAGPNEVRAQVNLGQTQWYCGRPADSLATFERAIRIDPDFAAAHHGRAVALKSLARLAEAEAAERRAIDLALDWADPHHGLGNILHELGRVGDAIVAYRQCIQLNPRHHEAHSSLLVVMNYLHGEEPQTMFDEHVRWADAHAVPLEATAIPHVNDRDPNRRLKIAYISPDLRRHAVAHFFEPLLANHDCERFHITCYAAVVREDEVSARLRSMSDAWQNIANVNDESLAAQLVRDGIDIAIDLAGHTADNRLLALARRPAPIQISYLGYPNTTGMRVIDYVITDTVQDPSGTERFHAERLIRLPRTMHAYLPPGDCPDVLRAPSAGAIRFGSFNRLEKVSARCVELWSDVMRAVPDATLVIKSPGLAEAAARAELLSQFARHAVHPDRLKLVPRDSTLREHYDRYALLDVALDTFPYNGTTTTCEALWMGVPVITLAGSTRVSRTTAGILRAIDLPQLVASDSEGFVAAARALADDRVALATLRMTMRERLRRSPLMDGASLARSIEDQLRRVWLEWCEGPHRSS